MQLTKAELILEALYDIQDNPNLQATGICNALHNKGIGVSTSMNEFLYESWEFYSGNVYCPVDCRVVDESVELSTLVQYTTCPDYHFFDEDTLYGCLRLDLLEHMIEVLENVCNNDK